MTTTLTLQDRIIEKFYKEFGHLKIVKNEISGNSYKTFKQFLLTSIKEVQDNAIQSGYELAIKDVLSEIKPLILSKENLKVGQDTINLDFNDGVKNCINVIENTYQSLIKGEK